MARGTRVRTSSFERASDETVRLLWGQWWWLCDFGAVQFRSVASAHARKIGFVCFYRLLCCVKYGVVSETGLAVRSSYLVVPAGGSKREKVSDARIASLLLRKLVSTKSSVGKYFLCTSFWLQRACGVSARRIVRSLEKSYYLTTHQGRFYAKEIR